MGESGRQQESAVPRRRLWFLAVCFPLLSVQLWIDPVHQPDVILPVTKSTAATQPGPVVPTPSPSTTSAQPVTVSPLGTDEALTPDGGTGLTDDSVFVVVTLDASDLIPLSDDGTALRVDVVATDSAGNPLVTVTHFESLESLPPTATESPALSPNASTAQAPSAAARTLGPPMVSAMNNTEGDDEWDARNHGLLKSLSVLLLLLAGATAARLATAKTHAYEPYGVGLLCAAQVGLLGGMLLGDFYGQWDSMKQFAQLGVEHHQYSWLVLGFAMLLFGLISTAAPIVAFAITRIGPARGAIYLATEAASRLFLQLFFLFFLFYVIHFNEAGSGLSISWAYQGFAALTSVLAVIAISCVKPYRNARARSSDTTETATLPAA